MEMCDEALEDVFHALIFAEGVDADDVFGDVVDREVFHRGNLDLGGIHVSFLSCSILTVLKNMGYWKGNSKRKEGRGSIDIHSVDTPALKRIG
jgi:hypothetical protein